MPSVVPQKLDLTERVRERAAERSRWSMGALGLRGRMMLVAMSLVTASLAVAGWAFVQRARAQVADVMGESARQMASTLAMAASRPTAQQQWIELERFASDLVRGHNVVFVEFMDAAGQTVALGSRDVNHRDRIVKAPPSPQSLMQVHEQSTPVLGTHLTVTAPILLSPQQASDPSATGLLGYVRVGVSMAREEVRLQRVGLWGIAMGGLIVLICLPLGFMLVHRVLRPIRSLVAATRRIIGGDLDARVEFNRRDEIGELSRCFNEMVNWVKQQQTDLATMNKRLAEVNRELETRIDQRTSQLETANKRLSQEIAEKEDFLRAVSHDLNAPLRNIDGMVSMLLMKKKAEFDEDTINRLERVKKNVEAETDLISELLELSRIKTRRQKMEPVELEAMIWELRGLFENDLKTKGIDLRVETSLPVLECERARIRQVFQNLIDNAIKYMGDGPDRVIYVGCVKRLTEAEFYVRDTGIGIHTEDIDKVFHVFRRGRNTQASAVAGKGVGLSSVKSIIETYSGRIWVESELGKGTTFRFTINGQYVPCMSGGRREPALSETGEEGK
ncbi:MAG TPA: HAMP domain-containing sensor histidine kinase [Tepidisphaeraceae bacterium]|nr:HAMP domain-containing sensor histidine kinase [Tepidisphaeraceae bacterium]